MLNINFGNPITTNGSGLNKTKYINFKFSLYGVMDSTMVFGTISEGSNPSGETNLQKINCIKLKNIKNDLGLKWKKELGVVQLL